MAGRTQIATKSSALIAMIADEDTVTGFLLAGVGNVDLRRKTNYLIVDSKTTVKAIEDAFKEFTTKDDIAIVLISQYTDCVTKLMKALGWWLMLVGTLRLASVWFGFFDIWALRLAVFSKTQMTDVHGRTFGVWTLLTCTLCFLCALNLDKKPIYVATFLSFIYAFGHFLTEYLIYHTMALSNLTTVGIFAGPDGLFEQKY